MEGLVRGDIVVIRFPYSDLNHTKKRPVFVVKIPKGDDIIVSQITASSYEKSVEIQLKNEDFAKGNLKRDSFVRIDKLASIEKSLVEYKIGFLKNDKVMLILEKICSFLKS